MVFPVSAAQASSVDPSQVMIAFEATKTSHTCIRDFFSEIPGDDCGIYKDLDLNQTYEGQIVFSSAAARSDGSFHVTATWESCVIGPVQCWRPFDAPDFPSALTIGPDSASFHVQDTLVAQSSHHFDFLDGTGSLNYVDDFALSSFVDLDIRNATLVVDIPHAPLPASVWMLLASLGGVVAISRRKPVRPARA